MYGKAAIDFPQRIVCLTAETAEIAFLVGAGERVVGVPGTARRPEAVRERARVGGFTTFRTDRILALQDRESHDIPIVRRAILRYALSVPKEQDPKGQAKAFVDKQREADPERVKDIEQFLDDKKKP